MFRILFIVVLLVVGFMLLKSYQRKQLIQRRHNQAAEKITRNTRMVRCAHCGLHVPEQEAITVGGEHFCTRDHQIQHSTQN